MGQGLVVVFQSSLKSYSYKINYTFKIDLSDVMILYNFLFEITLLGKAEEREGDKNRMIFFPDLLHLYLKIESRYSYKTYYTFYNSLLFKIVTPQPCSYCRNRNLKNSEFEPYASLEGYRIEVFS